VVEKIKQALERAYRERENPTASLPELLANARYYEVDLDRLKENRIITFHDTNSNIESYRLLRTQLLNKFKTDNITSFGITSANVGEGKSLTALNLAISLAKSADIHVMLIDGDIAHPSIHKLLEITPKRGLIDMLKEGVELEDAVLRTNIPNLWIIPGGLEKDDMQDRVSTGPMELLINSLSDNNRNIVIVDLPPVLAKDDTMAIVGHLDATILVVEEGATKKDEVARAAELLKQNNLIGCVFNKFSRHQIAFH